MSLYRVRYTPRADRDLSKLTPEIAQKVVSTIHDIRESPYLYIKKMKASNPLHPIYSLRVHRDIRALLSIHDDVLVIHVLEVEHRSTRTGIFNDFGKTYAPSSCSIIRT